MCGCLLKPGERLKCLYLAVCRSSPTACVVQYSAESAVACFLIV